MLNALVVEDSQRFRQSLCGLLREAVPDACIAEAGDGSHLLATIEALHPQIVFMDIRLPGANGFQLTKRIKTAHAEVCVVMMTNHCQQEYRDAAYQAGADHFFCKDELNVPCIKALLKDIAAH